MTPRSAEALASALSLVESHPLHRYLGVEKIHAQNGEAHFEITVNNNTVNPRGVFHGGVVYTVCDMACYAALTSVLADDEDAVTVDIHVSVMRAAKIGDRVRITGKLLKRGRNIGFMQSEAYLGEQLIARATVTKSIIKNTGPAA